MSENPKSHETQKTQGHFYALRKVLPNKALMHSLIKRAVPSYTLSIFKSKFLTPHTTAPLKGV